MYGQKAQLPVSLYFGTKMADMNATTSTKFAQQLYKRLKWAYKTVQHVIEKEKQRHKQNYNHKLRCTQLGVGDKVILKRTAFGGKHKIREHWEDTVYCVEGQPYAGLLVFKIAPIAKEDKVKIVHQNLLLPFRCNIEGVLRMKEIDKVLMDLRIACWQSLMMVCQRLRLCWQILSLWVRVRQSVYSVWTKQKLNYWVETVWGWGKSLYWHQ